MTEEYTIAQADKPAWEIVGGGISRYNVQQAGDDNHRQVCFVLCAPDKKVVGGAIGIVYWDWFELSLLWLPKELRGLGYGHSSCCPSGPLFDDQMGTF